eukprot:GGOE01010441.1.p3 GENE.GGOE01010441.1~~GGOE01010441.1.p3  ORF type:complete len:125 (-),score=1.33 GGOE01010441.1:234-608(-)
MQPSPCCRGSWTSLCGPLPPSIATGLSWPWAKVSEKVAPSCFPATPLPSAAHDDHNRFQVADGKAHNPSPPASPWLPPCCRVRNAPAGVLLGHSLRRFPAPHRSLVLLPSLLAHMGGEVRPTQA